MSTLKKIELTLQEWWNALKTPTPVKNKKKYNRKIKHKKKINE
jgi:hypothetical protein